LKKIYVGNLSFQLSDQDLEELFAEHGQVNSAVIIMDRNTGRSRGFGFVEMEDDNAAMAAIEALNGKDVQGRQLNVNEARPREPRGRSRW
jgi:RNA recognition motif-containing protein